MRRVLFWVWPRFDAAEIRFWQALDRHLQRHGLTLVLASAGACPPELNVAHVTLSTSLDACWLTADAPPAIDACSLGLSPADLLAREAAWTGPSIAPAIDLARRRGIAAIAAERVRCLQALAPALTVIWNGQHVAELLLAAASRLGGTPVTYVERAPIADALFVDDAGLSAASRIAAAAPWPSPPDEWRAIAAAVSRGLCDSGATWWEQPAARQVEPAALRALLDIPADALVVLFAGQVDEDTQQFLFSPRHASNLAAFEWLLEALSVEGDVYVLGKQHPKSRTPASCYRGRLAAAGVVGAWRDDVSLADALAVADRVAAVNSTVLYEALARQRPVLALGDSLLSGQGVAYETARDGRAAVPAWLGAEDMDQRLTRWQDAFGHLLSQSIYAFDASGARRGMHDAEALAARLARRAAGEGWRPPESWVPLLMQPSTLVAPHWTAGDSEWPAKRDRLAAEIHAWHCGQSLRHALLPAVDAAARGRAVVVWGDALSAALIRELLTGAGVTSATVRYSADAPAYVSHPTRRPFFAVACDTPVAAAAALTANGWTAGDDFTIVEPHLIASLTQVQGRSAHVA
jgi:hypothetical protein